MKIETETKDNGSWSQYLEVGTNVQDDFGDVVFKRKGYPKDFKDLKVLRKTEGRGAGQYTRWLITVPDDFPWIVQRTTNAGAGARKRHDILYLPAVMIISAPGLIQVLPAQP